MALGDLRARAIGKTPLASAEFRAIIGVSLFIMFGFGMIIPTLPLFAKKFGVGEAGIGLILTVFSATRLVGDFFAGGLIDRYGERAMTALGAVIVGVSSVAAGAAPNYPSLVILRGAGGVGSALFLGGLMAYLIGTVSPEERGRAMGAFQTVLGVGFILGPVVGGAIGAVAGVNTPLYVYGGICLAAAPLTLRAMRAARVPAAALSEAPDLTEDVPPPPTAPAWQRLRPLLRDSAYRAALAGTAIIFLMTGALQTLVPGIWNESLGMSKGSVGVPFTVTSVASLLVMWHAGAVSDRRGRKFAFVPALAVLAVVTGAIGYASSAGALVLLMGFGGIASAYTRPGPSAMVGDVAPAESRGVAVAGYRTAGDLGAFVGPVLAGVLAEQVSARAAFLVVAACVAAAFALATGARETAPSRRAEPAA